MLIFMKGKDIKGWKPLDKVWPIKREAILLRDASDSEAASYWLGYMDNVRDHNDEADINTGDEVFYISCQDDYEGFEWVYIE